MHRPTTTDLGVNTMNPLHPTIAKLTGIAVLVLPPLFLLLETAGYRGP